jgi:hypothetical protein
VRLLKARGTLVKSGVHAPGRWEWSPLYFKEIHWVGSNAFGVEEVEGRRQHGIRHYLDLVRDGRIDLRPVTRSAIGLAGRIRALADQALCNAVKVASTPSLGCAHPRPATPTRSPPWRVRHRPPGRRRLVSTVTSTTPRPGVPGAERWWPSRPATWWRRSTWDRRGGRLGRRRHPPALGFGESLGPSRPAGDPGAAPSPPAASRPDRVQIDPWPAGTSATRPRRGGG